MDTYAKTNRRIFRNKENFRRYVGVSFPACARPFGTTRKQRQHPSRTKDRFPLSLASSSRWFSTGVIGWPASLGLGHASRFTAGVDIYIEETHPKGKCNGNNSLSIPSPTYTAHKGAARQMYGSGSLRPPGPPGPPGPPAGQKSVIYATGQRHKGVRTTLSPQIENPPEYVYVPYPLFPIPLKADEFLPMIKGKSTPQTSYATWYGGRLEYPNGRPVHGLANYHYPNDFGFLLGKDNFGRSTYFDRKNFVQHNDEDDEYVDGYATSKPQDESDGLGNQLGTHPRTPSCQKKCKKDEFLCHRTCVCIHEELRCDGKSDCDGNEDEVNCETIEHHVKCDETKDYLLCPKTKICISKDWLCDGDDDCGDFSDETHCGFIMNCTNDQFQCENGLCIPQTWVCDNDNDCRDFSDEVNCTISGCAEHEFECSDSTCISMAWKCDKQVDCSDESDESDCDIIPPYCNEEEFQCNSRKCIKKQFKCDGDNDCVDWSDEDDCPSIPGNCASGEFKCKSGKCIPARYECDKEQDCEDNEDEDEAHCNYNVTKTCAPDEFTCDNGACILQTWVCDGLDDCSQGEDEDDTKCEIVCNEFKFPCSGLDPNDNKTESCINVKHRCDGQKDCPKGEDEMHCPSKRECERHTKCQQLCITTADGKQGCSCLNGYQVSSDGYSCDDINECLYATDPVCSQTCTNTVGSFKCDCMTGYVLRPDLRTCKAMGAPPTLIFANRVDIREVSLSNSKYTALLRGLHNAISLDFHYEKGYIFWTDVSMSVIRRAFINGTGIIDIVKSGLESPGGIALDWIHDLIFWTDSGTRRIEVASLDGEQRSIIAASEVDKPRAIAVHPGEGIVFWTNWGPNPKIERCEMEGINRKSIITESVFWPNGLTIDYTANQIYWADAKHNVIETSNFDGSSRRKVLSKGLPHPFALTIFEDALFWTDWHTKSITTANKITGAGLRLLHTQLYFPMDIHVYHPQRQPKYRNHCGDNNGGCAHMCLPNRNSFTCVCKLGQKLRADQKSCQKPDTFLLFARKKDLRMKYMDGSYQHQYEMVIPIDGIKSAVAVSWDSKKDFIYWSDVEKGSINRAFWNGTFQEVIIHQNIMSPAGISYDWATDKIYWTDGITDRIEVAQSDGKMRSLLIWEDLDKPRDIVVDPEGGLMFWSQWGERAKIERANMDGTNRLIIANTNLTYPNGLAVDHLSNKIYWVDGGIGRIEFATLDGSNRKVLLGEGSVKHPFGLDIFGNYVYWTDWKTQSIERANKFTGQNRTVLTTNMNDLMDVRVFHRNRKYFKHSCSMNNGGCSHLCLLKAKGHSCGCPTGITLGKDGKTCEKGPVNYLIFAHRMDIRQISLDVPYMADVVLPFPKLKMASSVDVDRKTGEIYWTDTAEDVIQKSTPDGKSMEVIIMHELETPEGIAIDSTGRKMYWTDVKRNSIEVAELDGRHRKILFHRNINNPRAITLHYHHGLMFWSDWGDEGKIEVASMDGTGRKVLVSKDLQWPNGLAIDRPENRLYWNDAKLGTIESSNLNGKDRRKILSDVSHPYGLVVVGNHIYWTDWEERALNRADKITGKDKTIIRGKLDGLMDVRSVQSDNTAENACGTDNGGCSHLCLRNSASFTCACPTGLSKSKTNDKHCELIPETFLLIATRYALNQVSLDTDDAWDVTLPVNEIENAIDVDFHWEKKLYYYTDIEKNVIASVSMYNLSDVKTIISENLSSPDGLAVDWVGNNIYWTNTGNRVIEVARLDGSHRKTLIDKYLTDPRSIAVFPKKGFLFWSDWGIPKIERSHLDGSNRRPLITSKIKFPIGLSIDYDKRRIYWIDAKMNEEKIETTDLHGNNRVMLNIQSTHPFSLTVHEEYLYWTDWVKKTVKRAEKNTGQDAVILRPQLDSAMGITMVSGKRQQGWNPCSMDNGGCTHLCLFRHKNYTCACPDKHDPTCKTEPKQVISSKCPNKGNSNCDEEEDLDDYDYYFHRIDTPKIDNDYSFPSMGNSKYYIMTLAPMLFLILLCITLVVILLVKKGKKKYTYGASRSFSNPNYYSPNGDSNAVPNNGKFIWKRLKYDKTQERVYEETVGAGSTEISSLIPTILTPCSSNCETVTPDVERSPSITPLHKVDVNETVS
ncbi:unnamed protein product [Phyllotreta striolata]|uniref:EGF-like domain-containing protein n=1 Tax=Phyllotreta striolata TaxID=444603 RepID=A0A9N9XMK8_PHYSR|nr:unnamed protein product [Phyllotreta striolata]